MITEEEKRYIAYQYGEGEVTYEVCNSFGVACLLNHEPNTELCRADVFDWCYANIGWASSIPPIDKGYLTLTTSPTGASVTVDGASCGTTPVTSCELSVGAKTVTISKTGYTTETRSVTILGDQTSNLGTIALTLAAAPPPAAKTVAFKSSPIGADLTVHTVS